jgi:hypothetical protein
MRRRAHIGEHAIAAGKPTTLVFEGCSRIRRPVRRWRVDHLIAQLREPPLRIEQVSVDASFKAPPGHAGR